MKGGRGRITRSRDGRVPGQAGAFGLVFDEVSVSYRPNKLVELSGGVRSAWTPGDSASLLWVAFARVTLRAPVVRF